MRLLMIAGVCSCLAVAAVCLHQHGESLLRAEVARAAPAEHALPARVLWVWERPADLRAIDPETTAVGVLEETLRLGTTLVVVPRRQPFALPARTVRIAVVRVETEPAFAAHHDDARLLRAAAAALRNVAGRPGVAALQVDFDARRSERGFYRDLLDETRRDMPAGMPLQMTALASWCASDDWIADLPVNSAIPMFFRMEPDRSRLLRTSAAAWRTTEPLCSRSVGVSTTEPWPEDVAGKRVYLFSDRGWLRDAAMLSANPAARIAR